jgi:hypothetical protein
MEAGKTREAGKIGPRSAAVAALIFAVGLFLNVVGTGFLPGPLAEYRGGTHSVADTTTIFELRNDYFSAIITTAGLGSLSAVSDPHSADVIGPIPWGLNRLVVKPGDGEWTEVSYAGLFAALDSAAQIAAGSELTPSLIRASSGSVVLSGTPEGSPVRVEQVFTLGEDFLDLDILVESASGLPVRIGDLAVGLAWRRATGEDPNYIFEQSFTKHHFIAGDGSFLFFPKPSGEPPFFMVLPKPGTPLEYFDNLDRSYKVFVHSEVAGNAVPGGTWRMPHTGRDLAPAGATGSRLTYGFRIKQAWSWDEMRAILADEGLFDVRVIPGMTVPSDLTAKFSLHTCNRIDSITAEFPGSTRITALGEGKPDHHLYEVAFDRLGENKLTLHHDGNRKTILEFFSTEPVETLIKKRSAFLVNSQQHRDTTKWYNGLYSVYDWKNEVLRSPDDTDGYDGWWGYVLASDDPALGKAPYIAAKNVFYPDADEIASVEYYLEHFVWDGLQRTDTDDPYPYAIYGVPNWKVARDPVERAKTRTTYLDRPQIWRSYDYPHIAMLYYHMYEIAKKYPDMVSYLDADGYLERAWQTARVYFIYPYEVLPWYETYKWGCYNELVIEKLIRDLERTGRQEEADWLRVEYEKKVKYFVYNDKYPYRSEYALDRTAFESSYAFAKYGTLTPMEPDTLSWYDKKLEKWWSHPVARQEDARAFMDRQHYAGLAVRGWLTPKYFLLGSDFTHSSDSHSLSYMAKMGGWSILDYGMHFADIPYDWLQLGYASYLSSWALMNTGTPESDYGFWAPGRQNDGAMGWAFTESKQANAWIRKLMDRGAWFYDGEADLGLGATFRMAATVLTDDPLFGWTALGGVLEMDGTGGQVIPQGAGRGDGGPDFVISPRDGVRNRFSLVTADRRFTVEVSRDGFAYTDGIRVSRDLQRISLELENRTGDTHTTTMYFFVLPGQKIGVWLDDVELPVYETGERQLETQLTVSKASHRVRVELVN